MRRNKQGRKRRQIRKQAKRITRYSNARGGIRM